MLESLDLTKKFERKEQYKEELKKYQLEFLNLSIQLRFAGIPCILVFEGWDAAGKGGAIKRAIEKIDPRAYEVHAISAPAPHEKRHHYLQRFWRKLPYKGKIGIFDRSWYGRVLVERIEGFATEDEWKRAYNELNQFEKWLTDDDYIIIKFWLHISKEEQLKRFNERMQDPFKQWKITQEDWRNRDKWAAYEKAAEEMFTKTNTSYAPWHIIEANYKWYARVEVLKIINQTIKAHLASKGIDPTSKN